VTQSTDTPVAYHAGVSKIKRTYRCSECGAEYHRWAGRCTSCDAWNTVEESTEGLSTTLWYGSPTWYSSPALFRGDENSWGQELSGTTWQSNHDVMGVETSIGVSGALAMPMSQVDPVGAVPRPVGVDELDRVLQGGLVPGSVTLFAGEPGIGKSTLVLQALLSIARQGRRVLLFSAEESAQQVRARAERLGDQSDELFIMAGANIESLLPAVERVRPEVVAVDSIQTVFHQGSSSLPGSTTQVRDCTVRLIALAKSSGIAVMVVSHVTKDGLIAGPRLLEHLVDTVVMFEGERYHALRMLRTLKHRFGSTGEVGLFEMEECGLRAMPDPSSMLLADRISGFPGGVVTVLLEGTRPLLVEVQALVSPRGDGDSGRLAVQGIDAKRLAMVVAVLESRMGIGFGNTAIFASAVGGVTVKEPAADLALALALVAARLDSPVSPTTVIFGEVGLAGEIRRVPRMPQRLAEAFKLGFREAIVPYPAQEIPSGMKIVKVETISDAVAYVASSSRNCSSSTSRSEASSS